MTHLWMAPVSSLTAFCSAVLMKPNLSPLTACRNPSSSARLQPGEQVGRARPGWQVQQRSRRIGAAYEGGNCPQQGQQELTLQPPER